MADHHSLFECEHVRIGEEPGPVGRRSCVELEVAICDLINRGTNPCLRSQFVISKAGPGNSEKRTLTKWKA